MLIKSDAAPETTEEIRSILENHGPEYINYLEAKFSVLIQQEGANAFEVYQLPEIELV